MLVLHVRENGCRFGEKWSYAHRQVDEQPTERSKKNDDKSAVAMLKKGDWHESVRQPVVNLDKVTTDRGNLMSSVTHVTRKATDLLCAVHRVPNKWAASFRIWSRRSLSYGRAQTCRNQSNV